MKDMPLGTFLVMGALEQHAEGLTARDIALVAEVSPSGVPKIFEALKELETRGMVRVVLDTQPPPPKLPRRTVRRYLATPIGVMLFREEKAIFDKITGRAA